LAKTWWCSYCLCVIGGPDGPSLDGRVPMASSICCKCGMALVTLPASGARTKNKPAGQELHGVCGSPLSRFRDLLPPEAWATVHDSACASGITASEISKYTRPKRKVNVPRQCRPHDFQSAN
jgi:hypothetical protein